MEILHRVSSSIWLWRIMFFLMAFIALGIYVKRPTKTVISREYIYLYYDYPSDAQPKTQTRWM